MNHLMKQFRDLGINVPFINNVAWPSGINAPGTEAAVDIYGHDAYPLGMNCTDPTYWPDGDVLPTNWRETHLEQSPSTPYMLVEFQGGAYQPWGGDGFEKCAEFTNHEFERVFYKNNIAAGATIFNVYMVSNSYTWLESQQWSLTLADFRWYELGQPWSCRRLYIVRKSLDLMPIQD